MVSTNFFRAQPTQLFPPFSHSPVPLDSAVPLGLEMDEGKTHLVCHFDGTYCGTFAGMVSLLQRGRWPLKKGFNRLPNSARPELALFWGVNFPEWTSLIPTLSHTLLPVSVHYRVWWRDPRSDARINISNYDICCCPEDQQTLGGSGRPRVNAEGALCEKFSNFSKSLLFRLCMRAKEGKNCCEKKIFGKGLSLVGHTL